jgi:hypothetical protein
MIVLIINEHGVFSFECESKAPVATYRHRPMASERAVQRMQPPAGRVHVFRRAGVVQSEKLFAEPLDMARLNFGFRSRPEEKLDSFMAKAFDHLYSV